VRFGRNRRDEEPAPARTAGGHQWSWQTAHVSTIGASHLRNTIECQDHSDSQSFDSGQWAYVIVADGHGSGRHFRSGRGAEFAVQALREVFLTFQNYTQEFGPEAMVATAKAQWADAAQWVVTNWRMRVHADLIADPPRIPQKTGGEQGVKRFFDHVVAHEGYDWLATKLFPQLRAFQEYADEQGSGSPEGVPPLPLSSDPRWDLARFGNWQAKAYGTTLLGVLIRPDALHWLQLGDGAMVKIVGGQADYLAPPPAEAIANETPSLCDDDAVRKVQLGTMPIVVGDFPSALILTTDGVPNSYEEKAGFFKFCLDIADRANTSPDITPSLERWLPEISRQGSGDDMSVALAWATEVASSHQELGAVPPQAGTESPAAVPTGPHEESPASLGSPAQHDPGDEPHTADEPTAPGLEFPANLELSDNRNPEQEPDHHAGNGR